MFVCYLLPTITARIRWPGSFYHGMKVSGIEQIVKEKHRKSNALETFDLFSFL